MLKLKLFSSITTLRVSIKLKLHIKICFCLNALLIIGGTKSQTPLHCSTTGIKTGNLSRLYFYTEMYNGEISYFLSIYFG